MSKSNFVTMGHCIKHLKRNIPDFVIRERVVRLTPLQFLEEVFVAVLEHDVKNVILLDQFTKLNDIGVSYFAQRLDLS